MHEPARRQQVVLAGALVGVAVLGLAGAAALASAPTAPTRAAGSPSAAAPRSAAPAAGPLVEATVQAAQVFAASGDAFFDTATLQRSPEELAVVKDVGELLDPQDARALLVVLPLPAGGPACLQAARLTLDVAATTGGPAEVGVPPGAATSLVEDRLPPSGEADVAAILDSRPRGVAQVTGPGAVPVDVTSLVRTWAAGGSFPSTGRQVEPGTPLLLVLRPTAADPGRWTVTLASPPAMTYRSTPGCTAP